MVLYPARLVSNSRGFSETRRTCCDPGEVSGVDEKRRAVPSVIADRQGVPMPTVTCIYGDMVKSTATVPQRVQKYAAGVKAFADAVASTKQDLQVFERRRPRRSEPPTGPIELVLVGAGHKGSGWRAQSLCGA